MKKRESIRGVNFIAHWLKIFLIAGVLVLFVRGFLLIPVPTVGSSMEATIHPNDKVIMEKFTEIRRFDVVVIRLKDGRIVVKRVIAMPGESITCVHSELFINEKKVAEPYLAKNLETYHSQTFFTNDFSYQNAKGKNKIGRNKYFVMGDNRPNSLDSRSFGVVDASQILGVAILVYSPMAHFRCL